MKKRYYIAAMFALGLVAQPAIYVPMLLTKLTALRLYSNKNNASAVC